MNSTGISLMKLILEFIIRDEILEKKMDVAHALILNN